MRTVIAESLSPILTAARRQVVQTHGSPAIGRRLGNDVERPVVPNA